jgi:hypothetical protein
LNLELEVLGQYLTNYGFGALGDRVFVHSMPDTALEGILLLGSLRGAQVDREIPNWRTASFQIIVRHKDLLLGAALCSAVAQRLTLTNIELDHIHFRHLHPRNDPVVFPLSKGAYLELSVTCEAVYIIP